MLVIMNPSCGTITSVSSHNSVCVVMWVKDQKYINLLGIFSVKKLGFFWLRKIIDQFVSHFVENYTMYKLQYTRVEEEEKRQNGLDCENPFSILNMKYLQK